MTSRLKGSIRLAREVLKLVVLVVGLVTAAVGRGQGTPTPVRLSVSPAGPRQIFVSPDVNCHQGYTTDGTYHYTIDTQRIDKRLDDANWTCIVSNTAPLQGLVPNHLGDGKYYNGKLYIVAEWWGGCTNNFFQSIVVFDAVTLARLEVHDISAQGHEVSGLEVVPGQGAHGIIYVTSYCDPNRVFMYDLANFSFLGTLPLSKPIPFMQGITYHQGLFYAANDQDGIYTIDSRGQVKLVYMSYVGGSHEGLDFSQGELRWLIDGGAGNKFVHYISFFDLAITWPSTAASWTLQTTSTPADAASWVSLPAPAFTGGSTVGVTNRPMGNRFFRLRQN